MPKIIFVTGGVMSGLGKGISTASMGRLLLSRGYDVSCLKIDPYMNVDAGTMRPTEHGEVFVTDDGGEIDQDLGTYERFLSKNHLKKYNMTTGSVYRSVIEKERRGDYLGKTVQIIPHLTNEIKERILELAEENDILLIEVGGTVGDYENVPFIEAARQLRLELGRDNILFVHVTHIPVLESVGEAKTKPTQHSVRMLRELGIEVDFLVCRSKNPVDGVRREKLALFCNVKPDQIISNPDVKCIYEIPLVFDEQSLGKKILKKLELEERENKMDEWRSLVEKFKTPTNEIKLGMIGKYVMIGDYQLADSYISVNEAIKHAAAELGVKIKIEWIDSNIFEKDESALKILNDYNCIIVPGGFGTSGVEGKIKAIRFCRENDIPFLGLCFGLQLAVVEFARNVCSLTRAHSTEIDPKTSYPVIDILPEQKNITKKGATMRLGSYPALLKPETKTSMFYKRRESDSTVSERHRHRYEVNPEYHEILQKNGLIFSGISPDKKLVEFIELPNHKYFIATQAHPEFTSRPGDPNPLFYGLIQAALSK